MSVDFNKNRSSPEKDREQSIIEAAERCGLVAKSRDERSIESRNFNTELWFRRREHEQEEKNGTKKIIKTWEGHFKLSWKTVLNSRKKKVVGVFFLVSTIVLLILSMVMGT